MSRGRLSLAVGVCAVAALLGACTRPAPGPTRVAAPTQHVRRRPVDPPKAGPVVEEIGDSYSSGYAGVGVGSANWSQIMARTLDVRVDTVAKAGTGFVAVAFGESFPHLVATHPEPYADVVLIVGGLNDLGVDPAEELVGAETTFAAARLAEPNAALIVVGPQWPGGNVDPRMYALRDAIRTAASEYGATFVDALGQWFVGHPELLYTDDKHPSTAGHQYVAAMIGPYVSAALAARSAG